MNHNPYVLPPLLNRLIESGVWPAPDGPSMTAQELVPIVPPARARMFADDETRICLARPPFHTIADELQNSRGPGGFWQRFGALDQISPDKALVIGDFGTGSDSPIVLHYHEDPADPPVLRLRWGPGGQGNAWVQGAPNFDAFARLIGLVAES